MTVKKCDVSVIIPNYNSVATIERAVVSVHNQTRPLIEIITIDDKSSEETTVFALERIKEKYKILC